MVTEDHMINMVTLIMKDNGITIEKYKTYDKNDLRQNLFLGSPPSFPFFLVSPLFEKGHADF